MADEQFTCCPSCRTVYRVTPQQLAMRGGNVRCGHCHAVFDGVAQLVSLAPRPREHEDDDADAFDELALGPPTVTLRDARRLGEPASSALEPPAETAAPRDVATPAAQPSATATPAATPRDGGAPALRREGWGAVLYAAVAPLLALVLVGQLAYHFRDLLAVRVPAARPILTELCRVAGCTVGAPREITDLVIGSSDLQADPAHQGLLILTATVRNRGDIPLAYPYLELALTDAQDQIVVRRALAPAEYAGGTADLSRGIPANSEISIKLFLDASATTQAGYRLYLFYI